MKPLLVRPRTSVSSIRACVEIGGDFRLHDGQHGRAHRVWTAILDFERIVRSAGERARRSASDYLLRPVICNQTRASRIFYGLRIFAPRRGSATIQSL